MGRHRKLDASFKEKWQSLPYKKRVIKLISDQVWNRCPLRKRVIKLLSDQVWSTDISYVPLEHGFMYLYAMIDVYSRYVLGWRLSPCKDVPNGCINRKNVCLTVEFWGGV